ncbi:MAG: hypothetical protein NTZ41_02015, partial [Sphingobacteriales bacterium]|nr:hypothetical protein [Sphingobacteriales bacterium]
LQSHSTVHILIKENLQFKIFDIKQIDETLKEVINYSVQNKISAEKMLLYLKEIMRMYDSNYCTPTVTRIN